MKSKLIGVSVITLLLIPTTTTFGFIGFGVSGHYDMTSVDQYSDFKSQNLIRAQLDREGFDNGFGVGGYLYLDFLPFVDLDIDFQVVGNTYKFNFQNFANDVLIVETGDIEFAWAHATSYITLRKKIFGLGIPLLGGVKLHAGGGLNFHKSAPFASISMMEDLLEDQLYNEFDSGSMEEKIINYIDENSVSANGIHAQIGLQFKLLTLDSFLYYRYTMAKDVYPDQDAFGSLNLRIGLGF